MVKGTWYYTLCLSVACIAVLPYIQFTYAEDSEESALLKRFQDVRTLLQKTLSAPSSCPTCSEKSVEKRCDFNGLCEFLSHSKNNPYLYENEKGERIPNFILFQTEQALQACYMRKVSKGTANDFLDPTYQKKMSEMSKKRGMLALHADKAFIEQVRKNHEESIYAALYETRLNKSIEDAKKDDSVSTGGFLVLVKTKEEIEKELIDIENRSGKKFSQQTRKMYLELLWAKANMMVPLTLEDDKDGWTPIHSNPFLNLSLFMNQKAAGSKEAVIKNQQSYQDEVNRSYYIFKDAQDAIIALLNKRRNDQNSSQIDNMIQRISTIRMRPVPLTVMLTSGYSQCPAPNAFYEPNTHSFSLCPQVMQMPGATLKSLIAHELGHSIDPCILTGELISIKGKKRENPFTSASALEQAKRMTEQQGIFTYDPKLPEGPKEEDTEYKVNILNVNLEPSLDREYEKYEDRIKAFGIGMNRHPFTTVIDCLHSEESVHARLPDEKENQKKLDDAIRMLKKTGATSETNPILEQLINARNDLHRLMKEKGACSLIPGEGKSQMEEAFADWISGEVLGNDMSSKNATTKENMALESEGFYLSARCGTITPDASIKVQNFLKEEGCVSSGGTTQTLQSIDIADALNKDQHPWDTERVNRIYFANPEIRKALGCTDKKGAKHCE